MALALTCRPPPAPAEAPGAAATAAFSALVVWPLNWRVGANSPSLWPTMFSVMYTGMNFFPLCTASVCPTISGITVERRDQVLMTFLSFAAVHRLDLLGFVERPFSVMLDERSFLQ